MIELDEVNNLLSLEFPFFKIDSDYWDLPYLVAGDFERFILKAYQSNDIETYKNGLLFIEKLHIEGSDKVKELATVGYLEFIRVMDSVGSKYSYLVAIAMERFHKIYLKYRINEVLI